MNLKTLDANEAVARIAYAFSEVVALYPITPATPMGEWVDSWAVEGQKNLWGSIPSVVEMQSEAGAAGVIHGAVQTGAMSTTFTASQGLLLMIPNMYRIAGELSPTVFHVAARSLATHALSIFGDHSDVMAARATGWAMLCSASVQEAQDFAAIAHIATLEARIPFLHFFDGFRTSHEISKIDLVPLETLEKLVEERFVLNHRMRGLSPDRPVLRGTAQNPDVYFQSRERINPFYQDCPDLVQKAMNRYAQLTGRKYLLFDYHGAADAERVIILMGSGCEAVHETVDWLNARDEKVGMIKVRLFRPFETAKLLEALPQSVRAVAVLDRTKEPGSTGEPLYLDCLCAFREDRPDLKILGGRYGLSSKEFTPAMIKAVYDNLNESQPKNHFTIGINDDMSGTSLKYDAAFAVESNDVTRAIFYGLGSDGTVGANKQTIKIIGENTSSFAQGYFVYDSKKAGAVTVSHLRFGPRPIRSSYLISSANFVACHQRSLLAREGLLDTLADSGTFLLNAPWKPESAWQLLPAEVRAVLRHKSARCFVVDADRIARECGMPGRINTVLQACFFKISGVLPEAQAIETIKNSIAQAYGKKGDHIVQQNLIAVDQAAQRLYEVPVPAESQETLKEESVAHDELPVFYRNVLRTVAAGRGDSLPVSAMPPDGTYPTNTAQWEKRNLAVEVPVWNPSICIQCGKCVTVCPHAAIRSKVYKQELLSHGPVGYKSTAARAPQWKKLVYTLQTAVEDCTGCGICVDVCPIRDKTDESKKAIFLRPLQEVLLPERKNWQFFLSIPDLDRREIDVDRVRYQQVQRPLFEFSGACSGCGETPYLRLLTQLFGDRLLIANATGCSSIYGGNLPTTPYAQDSNGRGPAWSNSLFEDAAEFGLGFRVSIEKQKQYASELLRKLTPVLGAQLVTSLLNAKQEDEAAICEQRRRVAELKVLLHGLDTAQSRLLLSVADSLVRKSVWIVGGDGWGYDIGYGGLDHVLASGANVKVLLLDTEVYSNTGGQCSKATPRGAFAKFAAAGKRTGKKDLGLMAMSYRHVYVAAVALGANDEHTLRSLIRAESYDGPALILAYSHCIAHGIDMRRGMQFQRDAVRSGEWLLYTYDPARSEGSPLHIVSGTPTLPFTEYFQQQSRFQAPNGGDRPSGKSVEMEVERDIFFRRALFEHLASEQIHRPPTNNSATSL